MPICIIFCRLKAAQATSGPSIVALKRTGWSRVTSHEAPHALQQRCVSAAVSSPFAAYIVVHEPPEAVSVYRLEIPT